jgi:hypothetical protein
VLLMEACVVALLISSPLGEGRVIVCPSERRGRE